MHSFTPYVPPIFSGGYRESGGADYGCVYSRGDACDVLASAGEVIGQILVMLD